MSSTSPAKGPSYISVKQLGAWVVAVVAGVVSLATAHESFILPGILERSDERAREHLKDAIEPITTGLETRLRFERQRVDDRAKVVDEALGRIERRLNDVATRADVDRVRERIAELVRRVEAAEKQGRK